MPHVSANTQISLGRFVLGWRRGNITLPHILQFCTGEDEEPVLGYKLHPSVQFVDGYNDNFLPTANTCTNTLNLPRGSSISQLPIIKHLHNLYDYAFSNSYFGLN